MIYAGTFHRTMDAKNRVTIPSDWLGEEGDAFWIVPELARNYLRVMPTAEFARQEETLDAMLPPGKKREEAKRYFYAIARQVETDKQGRVLLPPTSPLSV
jgi:MraZ protein